MEHAEPRVVDADTSTFSQQAFMEITVDFRHERSLSDWHDLALRKTVECNSVRGTGGMALDAVNRAPVARRGSPPTLPQRLAVKRVPRRPCSSGTGRWKRFACMGDWSLGSTDGAESLQRRKFGIATKQYTA